MGVVITGNAPAAEQQAYADYLEKKLKDHWGKLKETIENRLEKH